MKKGIALEADEPGTGVAVQSGQIVVIRYSISLNGGDVVLSDQVATFTLGKRTMIAGVEYGIAGMRVGGWRRFRASPHLCYRVAGVPGKIPPNAVLIFDVQLLDTHPPQSLSAS